MSMPLTVKNVPQDWKRYCSMHTYGSELHLNLKMNVDSFGMRFHKGRVNILQQKLKSPACEL